MRIGRVAVEVDIPELGFAVEIGEIELTECETVNQFKGSKTEPPQFTRGYGLVLGQSERKAISMSLVDRALRWNAAGLAVSTLYLGWTVAAQSHVEGVVHRTLATTPLAHARALVTPTPFNSLLWRVVVMDDGGYHEGYYSLLDSRPHVRLRRHLSNTALLESLRSDWSVQRLAWFSKGFYRVSEAPAGTRVAAGSASTMDQLLGLVDTAEAAAVLPGPGGVPVVMTDLRMGQTPWFVFSFVVAEREDGHVSIVPARQVPSERPPATALPRLWRRIWSEDAPL